MREIITKWAPVVVWLGLIFLLSSIPSDDGGSGGVDPRDGIAHLIEYAVLGALLYRALGHVGLSIFLAAVYGASDEIHQSFVAGRSASGVDWLFDVIGAIVGVLIARSLGSRPTVVDPED